MDINIQYKNGGSAEVTDVYAYKLLKGDALTITLTSGDKYQLHSVIEVKELQKQDDQVKFTLEELEKFYICAFEAGFESKLVCTGFGRIMVNDRVSPQALAIALIKAKGGFKE